tara:strand:- start:11484 stop:12326 length:843 start_codon:yes stop_codon:yes gene_type:complete
MNKLEKLLYRKASLENLMNIWSKGIKMYSEYIKACESVVNISSTENLAVLQARKDIHDADIPYRHYITSFKMAERELNHHILPEIQKIASKEEQKGIEFMDTEKVYKELAKVELFGDYAKRPDNVELIEVSRDIEIHIDLLKGLIETSSKLAIETTDNYLKAKSNLSVFKLNLQLATNIKRLAERNDYYYNQFKPKFDKEMIEADKYMPALLKRAKSLVGLNVDIKLKFLLDEYDKNKHDREKVWLFYTALKSRLRKIGKAMRENSHEFQGKMHLAKDII